MRSESRFSALATRFAILGLMAGGICAVAGCNPWKDQIRPDALIGRIGTPKPVGQIIEPKKCALRVVILDRPSRDPVLNDIVWRAVDEQSISSEARAALQANGMRMGRITGDIPLELESILDAPPPNKVEPVTFYLDEGEQTLLSLCESVDQISLILNRGNRVFGKDYNDAGGFFRVTPQHHDGAAVSLRFTPEIHHGPVQRSFQPVHQAAAYAPQQFKITDGQREESLRDLSADIVLEPGQVAVLGGVPERDRSLGSFLFTLADAQADQRRQRLVLVWAARNQLGFVDEKNKDKGDEPPPVVEANADAEGVADAEAEPVDRKVLDATRPEMAAAVDEAPKK